mgnify:CR=1 FL=1
MHSTCRVNDFARFEVKHLGEESVDEFAIKFYAPNSPYLSDLNIYCNSTELMNLRRDILRAVDDSRSLIQQAAE